MRQTLYIDELDNEDYQKYLDKLDSLNYDDPLDIIINTDGGQDYLREILVKRIRKFKVYNIEAYSAFSNGTYLIDVLYKEANSVDICLQGQYMFHIGAFTVNIGDGGTSRGQYQKYKRDIQETIIPYMYSIFNKKERNSYLNGEDVYIMPSRVKAYYGK